MPLLDWIRYGKMMWFQTLASPLLWKDPVHRHEYVITTLFSGRRHGRLFGASCSVDRFSERRWQSNTTQDRPTEENVTRAGFATEIFLLQPVQLPGGC